MKRRTEIIFSLLYVVATACMVFGLPSAVAYTHDHRPQLYFFASAAGMFLLASSIAGLTWKSPNSWHPTPTVLSIMAIQLLVSLWLAWDAFTHLHTLRRDREFDLAVVYFVKANHRQETVNRRRMVPAFRLER